METAAFCLSRGGKKKKRCLLLKEITHSPLKYLNLSLKCSISQDKINQIDWNQMENKLFVHRNHPPTHTERC